MRAAEIALLLPEVIRRTITPESPMAALLAVMEEMHSPVEDLLGDMPALFDPIRCPEQFLPVLARWVDLERLDLTPAGRIDSERMRLLVSLAATLGRGRGTWADSRACSFCYRSRRLHPGLGRPIPTDAHRPGGRGVPAAPDPRTGRPGEAGARGRRRGAGAGIATRACCSRRNTRRPSVNKVIIVLVCVLVVLGVLVVVLRPGDGQATNPTQPGPLISQIGGLLPANPVEASDLAGRPCWGSQGALFPAQGRPVVQRCRRGPPASRFALTRGPSCKFECKEPNTPHKRRTRRN